MTFTFTWVYFFGSGLDVLLLILAFSCKFKNYSRSCMCTRATYPIALHVKLILKFTIYLYPTLSTIQFVELVIFIPV